MPAILAFLRFVRSRKVKYIRKTMAGRAVLPSDEPGLKRASDGRDMGVKSLKTIGLGSCLGVK
jgi:hypothetical protein